MALVLADRVRDTTTTTGTGTVTLSGTAPTGYQNFSVVGNGNTTYYTINAGSQWEVGIGTYSSTGPTLARTTVLASSNSGSLVDFSTGTKDVFVTYPAEEAVYQDGSAIKAGTAILGVANGGTGATSLTSGYLVKGNGTSAVSASVVYDNGTNVGIGTTSPTSLLDLYAAAGANLTVSGDGATNVSAVRSSTDASGANLVLRKARGTTASRTAVASGDTMGTVFFSAFGGTSNRNIATIVGTVGTYTSDTDISSNLIFNTTPTGSVTPTERMRITDAGNVGIGASAPQGKLDVQSRSSGVVTAGLILDNRVANSVDTGIDLRFYVNDGGDARYAAVRSVQSISGNYADMRFLVSNSTTPAEAMRITPVGNVGINTTAPGHKLEVITNSTANIGFRVQNQSTSQFAGSGILCSGPSAAGTQGAVAFYYYNANAGGTNGTMAISQFSYDGTFQRQLANYDFNSQFWAFNTNGTERMRINSSGHVLINETSASSASLQHNFEVNGDIMSNGSAAGLFWANRSAAPSSGSDWYGWYTTGGTIYIYNPAVGNLASINPSTGAYTALSDAAKKKDFEPSSVGLDAVKALKPTLFRMATDAADAPKQLGFIAQEVKDHIPQAYVEEQNVDASGEEAVYIGLNDRPIIAALVKAVQELEARVAELEGK
jgi:hypothetical protein